jgi:signal transduction histidine kinase
MIHADQMVLPYIWRRYLSVLRALVTGGCLGVLLAEGRLESATWVFILSVVTVYSLVSIFWRWAERVDRGGILNTALDVAAFLLCVALAGEQRAWLQAIAAFYLFLAASTLLEWRDVLLTTVLTLAFVNSLKPAGMDRLQPLLLVLGMFGCIVALQRQSLLERLSAASRQAVISRLEAQKARENERERIAADFHDGPLQSFISIQMRLEILRKMLERNYEAGMQELRELQQICARQVTEVRSFIRGMRPVEADGAGLAAALRSLAGFFQKDSGIPTTFRAAPAAMHDDLEARPEILQIVREALNNIRKHSAASRAAVTLDRQNGQILLRIEDDGTGFPFAGRFTLEELELLRLGPQSIMRRVRALEGSLIVDSHPARGAEIEIRLPVEA